MLKPLLRLFTLLADVGPYAPAINCHPGQKVMNVTTSYPGIYKCVSATSISQILTSSFFVSSLWYYLATLLFEIPVLLIYGFRSVKAISTILIANFITVFGFHYLAEYLLLKGSSINLTQGFTLYFILAEVVVTLIETLIYIAVLRKKIGVTKIVQATIIANAFSAIIGGLIVNGQFGGLSS